MPKELEKHIVVCNWNKRSDRIIKELHSAAAAPETEIIVIADKEINEKILRQNPEYEKAYFVRSDPTSHDVLERARAHLAQCVIILPDDECADPDAKTALISLAIKSLAERKRVPKKPHIVAEIVNHHKIQHLLDAGVNEWVCSEDYGLGIIAQCALHRKLSGVYQQLLRYSGDTNEIYLVDASKYPEKFRKKGFQELSKLLNNNRKTNNPAVLLGVKIGKARKIGEQELKKDDIILNPREGEFDELMKGDSLIVMAFRQPDLSDITEQ